jgi:type IV pilus assembly protein PilY1
MNREIRIARMKNRFTVMMACSVMAVMPTIVHAASVALAKEPMTTTTATNVRPNVMFILDNSGSMAWDYLPDWVNDKDPTLGTNYTAMPWLKRNGGFNGVAYNPATYYAPPVYYNADGTLNITLYPSQTGTSTATGADASAKPNWNAVKTNAYSGAGTNILTGNASFYTFVPGEYCKAQDLKDCVAATAATATYPFPASLRWCTTQAIADMSPPTTAGKCQSINNATYKYPRYPKSNTSTITVSGATSTSITGITIGGKQILAASTLASATSAVVATAIKNAINACAAMATGSCTTSGFSATVSGSTVTVRANGTGVTGTPVITQTGTMTVTPTAFGGGNNVPGSNVYVEIIPTLNSYAYPGTTSKAVGRTDCAGTTCTYNEEMTNYANWWTYYQTRMQAMKTSVSRAFQTLDNRFRVGFSTISYTGATDGANFLGVNTFELAHKNSWFTKLFAASGSSSTPLRGALSKAGRYYANKISGQVDPVQYSCQQNFTILSTDGYWNTGSESPSNDKCTNSTGTGNYGPFQLDNKTCVGNLDAGTTTRPMKEGTTAAPSTLADVAKYYYETDLRTTTLGNCSGATSVDFPAGNTDVCLDNVFVSSTDSNTKQHMTTFTMGLGADGTLNYTSDYDTATSGDFYNLKNGLGSPTVNWPDPINNTAGERIDDLWHAAINGRGSYFSAKNPDQIIAGFNSALSSITAKLGSAAAAATSTLNPVAGNNYAFVASYTTVKWKGNLEARSININTGVVSDTASWCVENIAADTCPSPGTITTVTSGSSKVFNCVVPGATAASCAAPGIFDGVANTCTTEVAAACTGTLPAMVSPNSDTRTIYTANSTATALIPFDSAFATANPGYFNAATISGLSQWSSLSLTQQTTAAGVNLLNYLRGQFGYEMDAAAASDRLYRSREAVMGDAVESQPFFIAHPVFSYPYLGYSDFKTTYQNRAGTVYVGANDGMLHAFAADTGIERWAYIPSMVLPNMWKLADSNYSTSHVNFVNGSVTISDACFSTTCDTVATGTDWHTILVGGLNAGGRGYYALDVTDPAAPVLLWEFTDTTGKGSVQDSDLGYSYARPQIVRRKDGKWVVLVTSGYNNTSPGNGKGYLYVLDAKTGAILNKIGTNVGSTTTPSGLGKIAVWNEVSVGNQAGYVYGGDLLGNVWRFDINSATPSAFTLATLYSDLAGTKPQPITSTPVLGTVMNYRVVIVGTGKYLEPSDLLNTQTQSLYAIKDNDATITLVNPRAHTASTPKMVQQTITANGGTRDGTSNPVNFVDDLGWFLDFPDVSTGSERVSVDSQLVMGTLLVPTIVPSSTICNPGGYSWLNFFNYADGTPVQSGTTSNTVVSRKYDSVIVGINVIYIKSKPVVEVVTSTNPTPTKDVNTPFDMTGSGNFRKMRGSWRELMQ